MSEKQNLMKLIVENTCEKYGGNSRCDGDCFDRCEYCVTDIEVGVLANVLIDAGYRKASEVAREIIEEADKIFMATCVSLEAYTVWHNFKEKYIKDGE